MTAFPYIQYAHDTTPAALFPPNTITRKQIHTITRRSGAHPVTNSRNRPGKAGCGIRNPRAPMVRRGAPTRHATGGSSPPRGAFAPVPPRRRNSSPRCIACSRRWRGQGWRRGRATGRHRGRGGCNRSRNGSGGRGAAERASRCRRHRLPPPPEETIARTRFSGGG